MKYIVECSVIYNGAVEVEASNADEAIEIASNGLNHQNLEEFPDVVIVGDAAFTFGEASADNAYENE